MLYISLVVSSVLLLITNLFVWKSEHPVSKVLATSFLFALASLGLCMVFLPPVLLQAILLGAIVSFWGLGHWSRSVFLRLSCGATLLVYVVLSFFAYQEISQLQREFPYISIEERLPLATSLRPMESLPPASLDHLTSLETLLKDRESIKDSRASSLRRIHEETVELFVNQSGFGISRMPGMLRHFLKMGVRKEPSIPQPGKASLSPWPADSLRNQPDTANTDHSLVSLHQKSMEDFVNLEGSGFVKDRRHVAGFQEHQMSGVPDPPQPWKLQNLDLVGLIVHENPVAYVSEHLPRMDELRAAPTRTLDAFEAAGLPTLERGEDLYVRDQGQERRMLGAIRSTRQCLSCHGGERGDLLGAFSYRLTRGVTAAR